VVLKPGHQDSKLTILEWANSQLGKGQSIAAIELREELPRSTIGKVLKRELREPYWKKIAR
jgi:acyl-CoA synthetase (AMP-forming)/AMP-acid ligase II